MFMNLTVHQRAKAIQSSISYSYQCKCNHDSRTFFSLHSSRFNNPSSPLPCLVHVQYRRTAVSDSATGQPRLSSLFPFFSPSGPLSLSLSDSAVCTVVRQFHRHSASPTLSSQHLASRSRQYKCKVFFQTFTVSYVPFCCLSASLVCWGLDYQI